MADPGIGTAEQHLVPPTSLLGAGRGRAPAPGTEAGAPEGEAEGRRNAPDDAGSGSVTPAFDAPAVEGREPGPQWAPPPVRLGLPEAVRGPHVADPTPGTLRLVATRKLWDGGTLVAQSAHLAGLHPSPGVALHPAQLARLGLVAGQRARVSSGRGALVLDVSADAGVPEGCVAVALNLPGASATALIDAGQPVTDVRVEPAGEEP